MKVETIGDKIVMEWLGSLPGHTDGAEITVEDIAQLATLIDAKINFYSKPAIERTNDPEPPDGKLQIHFKTMHDALNWIAEYGQGYAKVKADATLAIVPDQSQLDC